jgi:hypothetical protein
MSRPSRPRSYDDLPFWCTKVGHYALIMGSSPCLFLGSVATRFLIVPFWFDTEREETSKGLNQRLSDVAIRKEHCEKELSWAGLGITLHFKVTQSYFLSVLSSVSCRNP